MNSNIVERGEKLIQMTYDTTLSSMNTAFALATALAWNEAIKALVTNVMPKGSGHNQLLMYALFVSFLYAVFVMLTSRKTKQVDIAVAKMA